MSSRACSGLEAKHPAGWVVSLPWGFGVSSTVRGTKSKGAGKEKGLWCAGKEVDGLVERAGSLP